MKQGFYKEIKKKANTVILYGCESIACIADTSEFVRTIYDFTWQYIRGATSNTSKLSV